MATVNEYKSSFLDRAPVGTVYMQLPSQSLQVPLVGKGQKQTNKHHQGSQIKSVPSNQKPIHGQARVRASEWGC